MAADDATIRLLGRDVSASRALAGLGRQALRTSAQLALVGTRGAAAFGGLVAGAQAAATVGQVLTSAGAGAGVLAPALLTGAQAMGAMKAVSETAKEELQRLQPAFDGIKRAAADAFRPEFRRAVELFGQSLPVVRDGVRDTAAVLGELAAEAARVFSGPAFRADLARIMATNTEATRNLGTAGIALTGAFWDIAVAAQDVWLKLTQNISAGAQNLAQWIEMKRESGELAAAIERGAETIGNLFSGIRDFGAGAVAIFSAINGEATSTAQGFADMGARFREWAESVQTQTAVTTFFANLRQAASGARDAVRELAADFAAGFNAGTVSEDASGLSAVFQTLGVRVRGVVDLFRNEIQPTLERFAPFLRDDVIPVVSQLASIFSETLNAAIGTAARIVREDLIPVWESFWPILEEFVLPAVESVARWLRDELFPAAERLAGAIRDDLIPAFDTIYNTLLENETELRALWTALGEVADIITNVVAFAVENNLRATILAATLVIQAMINVVGDLVEAFLRIASVMAEVTLIVFNAWGEIFNTISTVVAGIIGVMATLPGPLGAPWRSAQEAVNAFRTRVNEDLGAAERRVGEARDRINTWLDGIRDKTVTITIQERRVISQALAGNAFNGIVLGGGIPPRAHGGPVRAGEVYRVGEEGEELFVPERNGRIYDAATTARMLGSAPRSAAGMGGATNVYLTLNLPNALSFDRRALELAAPILRDAILSDAWSNGRRTGLPER